MVKEVHHHNHHESHLDMNVPEKKPKKRKVGLIIFLIVAMFILIGVFASFSSTNTNNQTTGNQPAGNQVAAGGNAKTYQLGEEIQAGNLKWKITSVATATQIGQDIAGTFFGEKTDGLFLIIDVEVENTANSAQYLMDSYAKLVDSQGREFSPDTAAALYLKPSGSAIIFEQINPGITKKGKIVYEVPEGVNSFNVKITSDLFTSNIYNIGITI